MPATDVQIERFILGPIQTNCYVLSCDGDCWALDVGLWPEEMIEYIRDRGLTPSRLVVTHGHADHVAGLATMRKTFPEAKICCPAGDAHMLTDADANLSLAFAAALTAPPPDETFDPGDVLSCGGSRWRAIDSSGHSPGGVSLWCPEAKTVFTGDALFAGGIGRIDIPGGSASSLLRNLRENLLALPDETRVLPGHGPETTIGTERQTNPIFAESTT